MAGYSLARFLVIHQDCHPRNLHRAMIHCAAGPFRKELLDLVRAWTPESSPSNPNDPGNTFDWHELKAIMLADDPIAMARDVRPWDFGGPLSRVPAVPNSAKHVFRKLETWLRSLRERQTLLDEGWSFDEEDEDENDDEYETARERAARQPRYDQELINLRNEFRDERLTHARQQREIRKARKQLDDE